MNNYKTILDLYERLERLVAKLPEPLQRPILHEMTPVKNLFLRQRPPRIAIAGEAGPCGIHLLNALFHAGICRVGDLQALTPGWREFSHDGQGSLRLLDVRQPASEHAIISVLGETAPDIFLFLRSSQNVDDSLAGDIERFNGILEFMNRRSTQREAVIGLLISSEALVDTDQLREKLNACLHTRQAISERMAGTLQITASMRFRLDGSVDESRVERENVDRLAQKIAEELPEEARLEMARLSGVRDVQMKIAQVLIKAFTAACAAVGAQPIPFADYPILTALQVIMISGIMHTSGRKISIKLGGEFIAAIGANVGAGLVLREGARALWKLLPGWGNAISGAIAGAGTYALGRAAAAYFIEGADIRDARKLFQRKSKRETLHN